MTLASLQWGRVGEDADILLGLFSQQNRRTLQWGRVGEDADICHDKFNAQTCTMLQWGRVGEDADIWSLSFSMESITCFNGAASVKTRILQNTDLSKHPVQMLQWGRVGEDADMLIPGGEAFKAAFASMGPRR